MRITGTGIYAPGPALSHQEVMNKTGLNFDGQRISEKLGIQTRHMAHLSGLDETTADFAEKAARAALKNAGVNARDVGLFIIATDTPEYISPATSMLVQGRLQEGQMFSGCYDIAASCSSFVSALQSASNALLADASIGYALVIGVYNMPAYFRPDDVFGYSIFADGAGAWLLGPDCRGSCMNATQMLSDGTQWDYVGVYSGGTRQPVTKSRLEKGEYGLQLLKRLPGDRNIKLWPQVLETLMAKVGKQAGQADHYIFTQINRSVIEEVMQIIGRSMEDTTCIMDRFGYTGSACIPMAFDHAVKNGHIQRGDQVAVIASGSGLAVSSALFTY